ncbi:MAG: hypothetical protein L3K10_03455 [Thermoplasmata archaeon]|nr:hypothetical protein [Thermoplasmata archaeon]
MNNKNRVRAIYTSTAIVAIALASGFALAAVLTSTTVNQSANYYQGGNTGANGYGAATLVVATTPAATSVCTSGTLTGASNAGTVTMIVSSTSGGTVCTTGDFAEEYSFAFSATISSQTNSITVTSQVGAGAVQTNTEAVHLGTGVSVAFTQTVDVFVDYGAVNPPATGVAVLDVVVQ